MPEYSAEQLAQFKIKFARKCLRRKWSTLPTLVGMAAVALPLATWFPQTHFLAAEAGGFLLVFATVLFLFIDWRCPACHRSLGMSRAKEPECCARCGIELTTPKPRIALQRSHAEQRADQFRAEYQRRRRRQLLSTIPLVATGGIATAISYSRLAQNWMAPVFVVVILELIGLAIYEGYNWRCPSCGEWLGRQSSPVHCPRCGFQLRVPKARTRHSK